MSPDDGNNSLKQSFKRSNQMPLGFAPTSSRSLSNHILPPALCVPATLAFFRPLNLQFPPLGL